MSLIRKESFSAGLMDATLGGKSLGLPFGREIFLLETHVAGTTWHQADQVDESRLIEDVELTLIRRPNNEHDPLAIEIRLDDKRLGFVPRRHNEIIARLMDAGKAFVARIALVERHEKWLELRFKLWLKDG